MENHSFSGEILRYLCSFHRKSQNKCGFRLQFAVVLRVDQLLLVVPEDAGAGRVQIERVFVEAVLKAHTKQSSLA